MTFIILTSQETGKELLVNLAQIQTITEHAGHRRIVFSIGGDIHVIETMETIYKKISIMIEYNPI